ncbi:DUF11 domain-containing protein [Mediterraneibacter agrestimuris]|uniref:DUF11 domain-containing protein n=1 Tax=Mediterraneibacter agrestimuris TaxID=2941333 RepID=UPI00203C42EE|nr:DUF11 domain-containing protein [Mediterraneibacter agrestimuris]
MAGLVNSSDLGIHTANKIERQEYTMKKSHRAGLFFVGFMTILVIQLNPIAAFAWGDNYVDPETGEKGRPSYTIEEINNGAIGATPRSDGENYKNSSNYPGQIIFNTISDSTIGNEKNFVGARECVQREDGSWEGGTKETVWKGNDITVEDGKYYIIRLYVHNNNPNGEDAVAENTHVSFSIPDEYDKENRRIQVNGFIDSLNAAPSEYWDYVNFNSEVPFHLDYIYGSALLENNSIGLGGLALSDDVVKTKSGGVLIGYDALDGRIPGCYQYANYVTIKVKAVFDYEYTVGQKVRLADSEDRTWKESVDAKVGDKVEFRIGYENTSDKSQTGVAIKDILPANLKYVDDTVVLKNGNHESGLTITNDEDLFSNGLRIGNYGSGANAFLYFTAEVVDENLGTGVNTLTNWSQAGVGLKTIQDYATIEVSKGFKFYVISIVLLLLILLCLAGLVVLWVKMRKQKHRRIR